MRNTFSHLTNLGVSSGRGMFDKRRVRLTNIFSFFGIGILVSFGIMNFVVGDVQNALRLFIGIFILYVPVFYLNYLGRIKTARVYLSLVTIIFATLIGVNSIIEQEQRFNEYLMIGIAAFVLFLFDRSLKNIFFALTCLLGLSMHAFRWYTLFPTINSDLILSLSNMSIGFICVYIFSSVFKKELKIAIDQSNARSERIREQSKLIERRTFLLRSIMENVPVFISMTDSDGRYLVVNRKYEQAFNKKVSEIEGQLASKFLSPGMNKVHQQFIARSLEGKESLFDKEVVTDSGDKFHLYGKMVPVKDHEGKVIANVEFGTDIQMVKEVEAELNYANNQKNRLISILAHDIRSPLSQFEMLINIGLQSNLTEEEILEFMQKLKARFDPLNKSINGLLEWSRVQLNGVIVKPEEFNAMHIIESELEVLDGYLTSKAVRVHLVGKLSPVSMDKEHYRIAIRNLLHNAVKFTPKGGSIEIRCEDLSTRKVTIRDTGTGIPEDKLRKIMNDQIVESTPGTDGELGTGLGLNLIKALLERNNCSLTIASEANGTSVSVEFSSIGKPAPVPIV